MAAEETGGAEGPRNYRHLSCIRVLVLPTRSKKGRHFSRAINEQVLRTVKDDLKEVKSDKG